MSSPVPWMVCRAILEAGLPDIPTAWPNEVPPDGAPLPPEPPVPFIIVEMMSDNSVPIELGGDVWQETGTVFVHVMVPNGAGFLPASQLADRIVALFRPRAGAPQTNPFFLRASIGSGAPGASDGSFYRLTTSIDWKYQDVTTGFAADNAPLEIG